MIHETTYSMPKHPLYHATTPHPMTLPPCSSLARSPRLCRSRRRRRRRCRLGIILFLLFLVVILPIILIIKQCPSFRLPLPTRIFPTRGAGTTTLRILPPALIVNQVQIGISLRPLPEPFHSRPRPRPLGHFEAVYPRNVSFAQRRLLPAVGVGVGDCLPADGRW